MSCVWFQNSVAARNSLVSHMLNEYSSELFDFWQWHLSFSLLANGVKNHLAVFRSGAFFWLNNRIFYCLKCLLLNLFIDFLILLKVNFLFLKQTASLKELIYVMDSILILFGMNPDKVPLVMIQLERSGWRFITRDHKIVLYGVMDKTSTFQYSIKISMKLLCWIIIEFN